MSISKIVDQLKLAFSKVEEKETEKEKNSARKSAGMLLSLTPKRLREALAEQLKKELKDAQAEVIKKHAKAVQAELDDIEDAPEVVVRVVRNYLNKLEK